MYFKIPKKTRGNWHTPQTDIHLKRTYTSNWHTPQTDIHLKLTYTSNWHTPQTDVSIHGDKRFLQAVNPAVSCENREKRENCPPPPCKVEILTIQILTICRQHKIFFATFGLVPSGISLPLVTLVSILFLSRGCQSNGVCTGVGILSCLSAMHWRTELSLRMFHGRVLLTINLFWVTVCVQCPRKIRHQPNTIPF